MADCGEHVPVERDKSQPGSSSTPPSSQLDMLAREGRREDDVEANLARAMAKRALFGSGSDDGARDLGAGWRLGRFEVRRLLGRGGMGAVYLVRDPELERDLAVKIMHGTGSDSAEQTRRAQRIRREALALAKLNHDNVATVHEVGEHDGHVFVAMEYIEGCTLAQWMRLDPAGPRHWREVVRVFRAAGRGLAAAHDVGLVHRDFKPDNVMIGDDGRVRVMDFGLARIQKGEVEGASDATASDSGARGPEETPLTRTGAILGTPAYMSPEQFLGGEVTAASDQFSFCVALHEALYGVRPFDGETIQALVTAVTNGTRRTVPRRGNVPSWLERIVSRGLQRETGDRYADMPTLLAELGTGDARRRRRNQLVGVSAVVIASAGVLGGVRYDLAQREAACEDAGNVIDETWNEASREALRAGLTAAADDGGDTAERAMPWLDRYAQSWGQHSRAACMNATVHDAWTAEDLDKSQWCLEERRLEFATLVNELARADEHAAREAVRLAATLLPTETCVDETVLAVATVPPDGALRPDVEELRAELSRAGYLQSAGEYEAGLEVSREVTGRAEALGWLPLIASSRQMQASFLARTGDTSAAEAEGTQAYMDAVRSDTWDVAADAASELVYNVGKRGNRPDEAVTWAKHAEVAISHAGDPLGLREAQRSNHLGAVYNQQGKFDEALESHERALELAERALGPEHPVVATDLNNLGVVYESLGDYDKAMECHQRALAIRERTLGPNHPRVASTVENIANLHVHTGDYEGAKPFYERAIAIEEAALGAGHLKTAASYINYGAAQKSTGDYDEARALYEKARAAVEREYGPEHPYVAAAVVNLGVIDEAVGDYEQAKRRYEQATAIWKKVHGPDHPNVASGLNNLAAVHARMGKYAEAKGLHERSLEIREKAFPEGHPRIAYSLTGLGETLTELGRPAEALPYLQRAVDIRSKEGTPSELLAVSEFELARAKWDAPLHEGGDRARSLELARHAQTVLASAGPDEREELERVTAWLEANGATAPSPSSPTPSGAQEHE